MVTLDQEKSILTERSVDFFSRLVTRAMKGE